MGEIGSGHAFDPRGHHRRPATGGIGDRAEDWKYCALVSPVIRLAGLLLPDMRTQGWGRIITSTSSGVVTPIPNLALSNGCAPHRMVEDPGR